MSSNLSHRLPIGGLNMGLRAYPIEERHSSIGKFWVKIVKTISSWSASQNVWTKCMIYLYSSSVKLQLSNSNSVCFWTMKKKKKNRNKFGLNQFNVDWGYNSLLSFQFSDLIFVCHRKWDILKYWGSGYIIYWFMPNTQLTCYGP